MKKSLLLLLLLPLFVFSQSVPVPQYSFATVSDMRTQGGTPNVQVLLNGLTTIADGNGGVYMWNATSTAADDGFITIKPTNITTGRWTRIGNGNTLKFSKTLSGVLLQTSFTVSYDLTLPFVPITVVPIPRSIAAAAPSWVSNITNTGFTINYITAPAVGTLNIVNDFIVVKQ